MVLCEDQEPVSTTDNEKLRAHIAATANRLRMIQVDFADDGDQARGEYLCEEIERALKTVLPDERAEFLEGLKSKFSTVGDFGAQPIFQEHETKERSTVGRGMLDDPGSLVQLLVKIFPTLPPDGKESVIRGLQEGRIGLRGSQDYSEELLQQLQAVLQPDDSSLEPTRVTALAAVLTDFVIKLEPLVWSTWRKLSPHSSTRPSGNIKNTMGKFACADGGVAQEQVGNALKELHQIIAAMITAVGRASDRFAKHHLSKLSPSEISTLVRLDRKGVLVSHEVKCWRKYQELASELTEASIEAQIREAIVDCVESLMKVSRRS